MISKFQHFAIYFSKVNDKKCYEDVSWAFYVKKQGKKSSEMDSVWLPFSETALSTDVSNDR